MRRKKIVVLGYMAACPLAGVIWQHIHYIVGLQRLGHAVYYVEDTGRLPYNPTTQSVGEDYSYAARILQGLSEQFGFREHWAYRPRYLPEQTSAGLSCDALRALYSEAEAILNVCGSHELHDDLLRSERILLVESDPGFLQVKIDKQDAQGIAFARRHHRLFTFGENIGTESFPIPLHGFDWLATRQPVVTDFWDTKAPPPPGAAFTTIANWGASATVEWRGKPYRWSKSLEFMNFVDAPALTEEAFELVADIPDPATQALFRRNRWRLLPTDSLNPDPDAYRKYVQHSRGEFTATKQIVVALNTGWFSDRSACYLAAGRPVITPETGFSRLYGGERGLFGFTTMEEVIEAVKRIAADYPAHSNAAREIAREHFAAEKVLKSLLDRANV